MPYPADFLADIHRTITTGRLTRYLTASGNDMEKALFLYERNAALTEAVFGLLQAIEVPVRNSMHHAMSTSVGVVDWFQHNLPLPFSTATVLQLSGPMQGMLAKARQRAGSGATVGKVIAELTFGFWPMLITSQYHDLWVDCMHTAFPHASVPRSSVHRRLEAIQRLRNRIAHHEPILSSYNAVYTGHFHQPMVTLPELLECVSWVSKPMERWLMETSRYNEALTILRGVNLSTITL